MKFNLVFILPLICALLSGCTGQKDSVVKHDAAKDPNGGLESSTTQKHISSDISTMVDENEKLKKAEDFLANEFPKSELKVKYSKDTQDLIRFVLRRWVAIGNTSPFVNLVNFLFSDENFDTRVIEAFEVTETKILIYKAVKDSKDPQIRFKLLLLFKKILPVRIANDDLIFIQNQLNLIKNETGFNFTQSSASWIKTNRDLVEQLVELGLGSKAQFDEKEYNSVSLSRAQREKMIVSFLKLKKNLILIVSPIALKEINDYRANISKIKKDIPLFSSKLKLTEITDENVLAIIVSLMISDIDSTQIGDLVQNNLLDLEVFKTHLSNWLTYEVSKVVSKYKDDFSQFQVKKVNYLPRDYFPEMRKSLAMSQILSRERVERLRVFLPVAKMFKFDSIYKNIVDMDIFFKRLLTSNTTLLILKLYSESSMQLNSEVLVNNQIIKKDRSKNLKMSLVVPNVMTISEGFYLGELADQFEFSINDRMLQKFEILEGVDQGINLGFFRELGFKEEELLHSLFLWLSQSRLVQVDVVKISQLQETKIFKLHENLKVKMASTEWQTFKAFCSSIKSGQTPAREFELEDLRSSLLFGKLAENIEASRATQEFGASNNLISLFPYNGEVTKSLEFLRTDVSYVVLYIETLMDSLAHAGIDKSKIEKEVGHFKSYYSDYLKDYLSYIGDFDDCYYQKQKMEQVLAQKIIFYEKKYWASVISKSAGQNNQLVSGIVPLSYQLPDKIKERSYVGGDSVHLNALDFFFRVKQYLQYGLTIEGQEKLPPIDTNVAINFSSKMATQAFYKNETLKVVAFQNESLEAKIQKVIAAHDYSGITFVSWFAKSKLNISKFSEQLDSLFILHRFAAGLKESFVIDASVGLEQLTKAYHHVIYLYHLSEGMKNLLTTVGLKELGPMDDMLRFKFILRESEVALPFFDGMLKALSQPFMGYFGDDDNFMGGGHDLMIKRPMQLLSTDFIMTSLFRYYDETYLPLFRSKKLDFSRYVRRMTQEKEISKKVVEYINFVEANKTEQEFKLQLRTTLQLSVPLYSAGAKDNLSAIVLDMDKKLSSIDGVKAKQKN